MIQELQLLMFVLYFLHVAFSNVIVLILFLFSDGIKRKKEGKFDEDKKSERKRYVIFLLCSPKYCLAECFSVLR